MSYVEALLVAEARKQGRGVRSALVRHRGLTRRPLGLLFWQLGAEPFTAAAVAWGFGPKDCQVVVPGEPRDRELAFRELTKVAHAFNAWFEGPRDEAPQIVLANRGNLTLMGRLGRRLAFLPTDGDDPADPELVRFGRHLLFLAKRARFPGQQLVIVLTELMSSHWITELSKLEAQNLPALEAAIAPPKGKTGHAAAFDVENDPERIEVGPLPGAKDDTKVGALLTVFNQQRSASGERSTDEAVVGPLRRPIEQHYRRLVARGWPLLWRCLERERGFAEARSVPVRWEKDIEALDRHIEWIQKTGGRVRTRQTSAQAAYTLHGYEDAQKQLEAAEALDDRLRMLPYLESNQALGGRVVAVDLEHREQGTRNRVKRQRVTIETEDRCTIVVGKELYWTETPNAAPYEIESVEPIARGSRVVLKHTTGRAPKYPEDGVDVIFSIHHGPEGFMLMLPRAVPWTHTPHEDAEDESLEEPTEVWE